MFTGIIGAQAILRKKQKVRNQSRLTFELLRKNSPLRLGESVSIEGVCLTVSEFRRNRFSADVIPETLQASTLGKLKIGDRVNFEQALRAGARVGGHFVTGHMDGVGVVGKIERRGENFKMQIKAPREILRYCVPKGSVAVDGISFTLQKVGKHFFTVGVTPHTFRVTTLQGKRVGQRVNLEVDLFAKLVRHFLKGDTMKSRLTRMSLSIFLALSLLGVRSPALYAQGGADYSVEISTKFGRGLVNVLSSPLEIPCTIRDEVKERGAVGVGTGLFLGIAYFARRVLIGVDEVGTFMIPMEATIPAVCAKKAKAQLE